jgi:hypothetical protein
MNTSPIDSYDGAAEMFTFGANSAGVWIFLGISALLFVGLLVRAARHEGRSFASLTESEPPAPDVPADGGAVPKSRTALDPVPIGE